MNDCNGGQLSTTYVGEGGQAAADVGTCADMDTTAWPQTCTLLRKADGVTNLAATDNCLVAIKAVTNIADSDLSSNSGTSLVAGKVPQQIANAPAGKKKVLKRF